MILRPATITLAALLTLPALSQPAFIVADIHPSPYHNYPSYSAVLLPQDRYIVRNASMVDLVATAWNVDPENISGGPSWLERDRFDIVAKVPHGASKNDVRLMVRDLLTSRFHLALHFGSAPMPAYILTSAKDNPKLKESEDTGNGGCEDKPTPDGAALDNDIVCHNIPMSDFSHALYEEARGYFDKPVADSTGLVGAWEFELKWTSQWKLKDAGPDGVSVFDAVQKQLGLKLTLETSPRPVLLVDSVLRQPTANVANIDELLPPQPPLQFDVATIKPSKPGARADGDISGDRIDLKASPLRELIDLAWDLNENGHDNIVNAPKWLDDDKYDILAKVSPESTGRELAGGMPMDIYEAEDMLRALLIERFQIKTHLEERSIDAYTLTALNPKLKPADPSLRTVCKEGPGPDGKDPRLTNGAINRLVTCRNISMAEICDEFRNIAGGYIFAPVLDATGLKGSYDFTLAFSSADRLPHDTSAANDNELSTPDGAVSLFSTIKSQLGLKLEKTKRKLPVLVIDHIEEKPTAN